MKNKSRTHASVINSFSAGLAQILTLLMSFVSRTIFIRVLGEQYLGLNGLFSNILSILSFAELGVGAAITFSLYKPLANHDEDQVLALMQLYKKVYHAIALIIFTAGIIVLPFLDFFIKGDGSDVGNIHIAFFLFLMNSVSSYLWNYKRSIFFADQSGYINSLNLMIFQVSGQLLQILFLLVTPSYYLYLIIQICVTIFSNLQISRVANKQYPFLRQHRKVSVPHQTLAFLKRNVIGMISAKLGGIVVLGTDNIILSSFLGLATVAVYSNYTLIMNGMISVINQAVSAVTASIGNLRAVGNPRKEKAVFYKYSMISALIGLTVSVGMVTFFSPFIKFWVGKKFVLDATTTLIIVIGFFVSQLRQANINFTNAYGLYWEQRLKSIVEAVVNLIVSLILIIGFRAGINSVILGNLASNLFVNAWWEPLIVLKSGFKATNSEIRFYARFYLSELTIGVAILELSLLVSSFITFGGLLVHASVTLVLMTLSAFTFDFLLTKIVVARLPVQPVLIGLIRRFTRK